MALILALDTSTEACSCALLLDDHIVEDHAIIPRQHARQLLPMVQALLQKHSLKLHDLDALAFGRGPGSFTGLRIAAGVMQGLALATDLPVVAVSTLASLALQVQPEDPELPILACLDARIDEMYWAWYRFESGLPVPADQERLGNPEVLELPLSLESMRGQGFVAAGNGLVYRDRMPVGLMAICRHQHRDLLPRASAMARLAAAKLAEGEVLSADQVMPLYLRDKVTRN